MLLKHSAWYLLARGVPGVINFLGMALYTRLLSPEAYGQYALIIASTGLVHVVFFQWLDLGLLRFLPAHRGQREVILSTIMAGAVGLIALTGLAGMLALLFIADPVLRGLVALGIVLLWVGAFFNLNLELARSELSLKRYGLLALTRAVVAVSLGAGLAYQGFGAFSLLFGSLAGIIFALLWHARHEWAAVKLRFVDITLFRQLARYGLPLAATFALGFVISTSDRFFLAWFLGDHATGLYAVSYDLTQHTLGMLMAIINLAAYPLAVRALEQHGKRGANQQLAENAIVLVAIALPSAAGLALLAPNVAGVFLGPSFREVAAALIPWIALAAFLAGIKAFYFDLSFQLGKYTMGQVWVVLMAAIVNVGLNLWWIPVLGIMGAAYATVVAYGVGLGLSWAFGRRVFDLPLPVKDLTKMVLATAGMAVVLMPLVPLRGVWALAVQVICGALVFGGLSLLLNVGAVRAHLSRKVAVAWSLRT